ncbi:LuxR family transcriptional regulator [Oleomonas cavernae]|uniref:LuxR family transcriptional regulator n=1 Tax=Oleomonas cavernae TaxID=2320859 RepID=A0A418WUD4_9PROT|nr:helix-turn-helix transcriptional regulator [Oleomonas cavernae]RJF94759.1 LuxR family transcriptional regulator [Oleomonas cavernae]
MLLADDHMSTAMVREALQFSRSSLDASATVFFWIEDRKSISGVEMVGMPEDLMDRYLGGMNIYDPLNIFELLNSEKRIAVLEQERCRRSADDNRIYAEFLGSYGLVDEVDFLFWHDGAPFAFLGILKRPGDPPFSANVFDWEAMRGYLEFNLKMHSRMRRLRLMTALAKQYGLTPREIEVVGLLNNGASNLTIAQILGIGVATVKTYIINILNKLGVESRAAIVAFTMRLQMP